MSGLSFDVVHLICFAGFYEHPPCWNQIGWVGFKALDHICVLLQLAVSLVDGVSALTGSGDNTELVQADLPPHSTPSMALHWATKCMRAVYLYHGWCVSAVWFPIAMVRKKKHRSRDLEFVCPSKQTSVLCFSVCEVFSLIDLWLWLYSVCVCPVFMSWMIQLYLVTLVCKNTNN